MQWRAAGARFWFHALRNCFITVANRDLMLPVSLTKRLVNHAKPQDVTESYAADWTMEQLRTAAQRVAELKNVVDSVRHVRVYSRWRYGSATVSRVFIDTVSRE